MNQDALTEQVGTLAALVVADRRWKNDTLSVAVLGMLLYGYALAIGRMVMMLEVDDINAAVLRTMVGPVGAAKRWSEGLVADASGSALDKSQHPGNFDLVGAGHAYFGVEDMETVVNNVFENIASVRRRASR